MKMLPVAMSMFAGVSVLIAAPNAAFAIERYTSTRLSCGEVQAKIRSDGAAIMRYQSTRVTGLQLYGRYVRNGGFCSMGEAAQIVYIPAADTKSCQVRECKVIDYNDDTIILRND